MNWEREADRLRVEEELLRQFREGMTTMRRLMRDMIKSAIQSLSRAGEGETIEGEGVGLSERDRTDEEEEGTK